MDRHDRTFVFCLLDNLRLELLRREVHAIRFGQTFRHTLPLDLYELCDDRHCRVTGSCLGRIGCL